VFCYLSNVKLFEGLELLSLLRKRREGYSNRDFSNYFRFQKYLGKLYINEVEGRLEKQGVSLRKLSVLELAVGIGGYSAILKNRTRKLVINDLRKPYVLKLYPKIKFKRFDVTKKFPIPSNSFDLVISSSLIEHVKYPRKMLKETHRILKPNGWLLLGFPPFYSLLGGHVLKPFHFLGKDLSIALTNIFKNKNIKSYERLYERSYGAYGLYPLTISSVKQMLLDSEFEVVDMWNRFGLINTTKIPIFNEFLTQHVCFLCKRK